MIISLYLFNDSFKELLLTYGILLKAEVHSGLTWLCDDFRRIMSYEVYVFDFRALIWQLLISSLQLTL